MDWNWNLLYAFLEHPLFNLFIGVAVTVIVAYVCYKRAGDELRKESQDLKTLNELMLQAMESAGMAEFTRDEAGHIKSLKLKFSVLSGELAFAGQRPEIKIEHE